MFLEIVILLATVWGIATIIGTPSEFEANLPRVGVKPGFFLRTWWARWEWYRSGHGEVSRTYSQSKNKNYVTQTLMGDTIVLSPKFLNELNMLPESKLSSTAALVDSVMGQYNGVDLLLQDHLASDVCRGPLTRKLSTFIPGMTRELNMVMAEKLDSIMADSQAVCTAYDLLFHMVHRMSSLVFVGKAHCYNATWTSAVTDLPIHVEITKFLLLPLPSFLRRFVAPLIPQRYKIFRQRAAVRDLLFPSGEALVEEDPSVMKLFLETGRDNDPDRITARLLILTAAALHTSSMAVTHAMFDLCAMREYIEPLRIETQTALAEDNGQWQSSIIKKLRRLDSFLKEYQRLNQSTFLGFDRKVMSPIKLSDGRTVLPPGASIAIPGGPMSRDSMFYKNPQRFDGLRFYRPEDDGGGRSTNAQTDYTGIEPGNLSWGNGRFTCPGRWYAAAMIKMIVANLLLNYEVSFPPGQTERPANTKYDTEIHPDFGQKIVFRKRNV